VICPYCRERCSSDQLMMSCGPHCPTGTTFPVKALRRGRCAHGRLPRARRVCPACARAVPREYAEASSRAILVVGTDQAGKSTWLTEIVRQLSTGEIAHTVPGLSVHLLGDSSRARYANLDAPTTEPLLISIRRPGCKPVVLALYELPEDCPPDLFGMAAGVVRLVDPTRLPGVRRLFGLEPLHPTSPWAHRVPVAVTVSKLDLVWDMFDNGSPLRRPSPHGRDYVESDGLDVHHEVEAWLTRWGGIDLPAGHRCFALSALAGGYRVADPLLWLLTRFGALGVARGRS
jgi:hypothetical protein